MTSEMLQEKKRRTIPGLFDLPSISPLSSRLLEVISDDECTIKELAQIIRQDATLTARIISLANSAYFAQPVPIVSIEDAIFKSLGLRLTKNLALSMALADPFESGGVCPSFNSHYFWLKAVITANLASSMCRLLDIQKRPNEDMAYLAGLLHDFGLLPLVCYLPTEIEDVLKTVCLGLSVHDQLQASLDTDHHEVGAMLAKKWKLPDPVIKVIQHHVDDEYDDEHKELVGIVYIASCWVTQYMESNEWDIMPDETEHTIARLAMDREQLKKILKKQHQKMSAFQSMADAITCD